jgi:effector-binding domain-containing protein
MQASRDSALDYRIEVQTVRSRLAMSAQICVPLDQFGASLGRLLETVQGHLEAQAARADGPPFCRHHGAGEGGFRMEAGLPIARTVRGSPDVQAAELPGGQAAITWHFGPYDGLRSAYRALGLWLKSNHVELAYSPWEYYWISPRDTEDASAWRTEIVWPLR